jgi:hypothetical protein
LVATGCTLKIAALGGGRVTGCCSIGEGSSVNKVWAALASSEVNRFAAVVDSFSPKRVAAFCFGDGSNKPAAFVASISS